MTYPASWLRENIRPPHELWSNDEPMFRVPVVAVESVTDGATRPGTMREWPALGVSTRQPSMLTVQGTGTGIDGCAGGLAEQEVTA